MKKILFVVIGFGLVLSTFAQGENKKRPSFGVSFLLNDFRTAQNLRTKGLPSVIRSKEWHKTNYMTAGIAVSYLQGLSNNFDFATTLSGSYIDYPIIGKPSRINSSLLLEATATVNFKLLADNYCFTPFLTAGAGASKYRGYYGAFIPVGLGAQGKIANDIFLMINSQYRVQLTENASYHFYHSIGVVAKLK